MACELPIGAPGASRDTAIMANPTFKQLNGDWNAEPNAPDPVVVGTEVKLVFVLNPWAYEADEGELGRLTFPACAMWRLGPTNDEGWYRGQCRYSKIAPA